MATFSDINNYYNQIMSGFEGQGISAGDVFGTRPELPSFDASTPQITYNPVDIIGTATQASDFNFNVGVPRAIQSSQQANASLLSDVLTGLSSLFGSESAFRNLQSGASEVISDQLQGRLASGTRTLLGRRALATGTSLGRGAVQDSYTGLLGLTAEEQAQRGVQNYQSIFQTYRSAIPLESPSQYLQNFTLNPANAVQSALYNAMNYLSAQQAQAKYTAVYDELRFKSANARALAEASGDPALLGSYNTAIQLAAQDEYFKQREAESDNNGGLFGDILQVAGTVAGTAIGGPIGGMIGGSGFGIGTPGFGSQTSPTNTAFGQVYKARPYLSDILNNFKQLN